MSQAKFEYTEEAENAAINAEETFSDMLHDEALKVAKKKYSSFYAGCVEIDEDDIKQAMKNIFP